jgi:hypothetical protein
MTNLSEKVPVQISVNEDSEAIAIDRRMFVKGVGFAVLTAQCLSLIRVLQEIRQVTTTKPQIT